MNNTGYKLATKIKITKKVNGLVSDSYYSIGKYVSGNFIFLNPNEIALLSDTDYTSCILDTKRYIAEKEDIPDINNVLLNENEVRDLYMCPLPLIENPIAAGASKMPGNEVGITFTSKYPVTSEVTIIMKYGSFSTDFVIKNEASSVSAIISKDYWGKNCLLEIYVGISGITNDANYIYTIPESVMIPDIFTDLVDNTPKVTFQENEGTILVNIDFPRPIEENIRMDIKYIGGGKTLIIKTGTIHRDFTLDASKGGYFLTVKIEKVGGNVSSPVTYPDVVEGYIYGSQYKYLYETYTGTLPIVELKVNVVTVSPTVEDNQAYITFTSTYPLRSTIGIQVETTDGNFSQNITLNPNMTTQKEKIGYFFKGKEVRLSILYIYDGTTGNNTSVNSDNVYIYSIATPTLNIPS